MTSRLPPDLLQLFTPRPQLKHLEPLDRAPDDQPRPQITGLAAYVSELQAAPKFEYVETPQERKQRRKKERAVQARETIARESIRWNPHLNVHATDDPYKTIIVARLNYDTTEDDLRKEFEVYGEIVSVRMVNDTDGNFRGYAFIEYKHEADMREAFNAADGMRILGRRIAVDVERGRTVKGWAPRRFAGGLGGMRIGAKDANQKNPGRFDPSMPPEPEGKYDARNRDRFARPRDSADQYRARGYQPGRTGGAYEGRERERSRGRDYDRRDRAYDRD
ncbi:hypothetical protein FBU59_004283, partial [Linderina macrospora]